MGAQSGSITANAYYVVGDIPKTFRQDFIDGLLAHKFRDIDRELDHDDAWGWVTSNDVTSTEFDTSNVFFGDYVMATLRHDAIKIPAATFKVRLKKAYEDASRARGGGKLSKTEREDIKERLTVQMKKVAIPNIKTFDLVWNMERQVVWFFGTNKKINEAFVDLFQETFGIVPYERNPYSQMEALGLEPKLLDAAVELESASMSAPPSGQKKIRA